MASRIRALAYFFFVVTLLQVTHSLSSGSTYSEHLKTKIADSVAKTERRLKERSAESRKICNHCKRVPVLCICKSLPPKLISTSTNVLVLQHPREFRRKSLSTVPLMPLVLEKCLIKVGYNFTPDQLELVQECLDKGQKPLLLFPGPSAIDLDADSTDLNESDSTKVNVLKNLQQKDQLLILVR